jgi:hypothetical protein
MARVQTRGREQEEAKYARCLGAFHQRRNRALTRGYIHSLRGSLKGKGVLKAMMKDRKCEEKEREAKCSRCNGSSRPKRKA